jgi:glycosyltransferase involved in cell wall biosynthesis
VILHANGLSGLNIAGPASWVYRLPVLVHFHGSTLGKRAETLTEMWRRTRIPLRFVAVSNYSRSLLCRGIAAPVDVLPNPFDGPLEDRRYEAAAPFRVAFVGGRRPEKGLDLLIDVAGLLRGEDIQWDIWGIGLDSTTPYLDRCREKIDALGLTSRFRWHGWLAEPAGAYSQVDALLVPSLQESFGRVAVEGMRAGLPVVATRIPGHAEVIREGGTGLLFDPRLAGEGARHVREIVRNSRLRRRLGESARESAAHFDIARIGPLLEREYMWLLGQHLPSSAATDGRFVA